ncbi:MAG TPA: condensation domain-containing protein, partial [Pyrinomonadaceae bacterium]|nr:condensation domain-containing protein [Pyrinomonadaceae bacterium]
EFHRVLRELVQHCLETGVGGHTPSDFPLASINMAALDRIMSRVGQLEVEDIYPLTPMQQGMLFHALMDKEGDAYLDQMLWQLEGELNLEAFAEAWQEAVQRHAPLRSGFQWEGLEKPLQVVARNAVMSIEEEDWRGSSAAEQQERIKQLCRADRVRGFELTVPPLMRLKVLRTGEQHYQLMWSFHHLLLDGWSVSLLLTEVFASYRALVKGEEVEREPVRSFRDYIEWLGKQSLEKAEEYWRKELRGIEHATVVNVAPANGKTIPRAAETAAERYGEQRCSLSREQSEAIQEMTRRAQITINTVVQGAWAVLLSAYSGDEEVIFGSVVSGRPPELRGVEEMVGPFINTLPVRVKVDSEQTVEEWLKELQNREADRRQFEHSPLVEVHGWSGVSRGESLIGSLVIFQNLPAADSLRETAGGNQKLKVGTVQVIERVTYPLCLKANNSAQGLFFSLQYDRHRFDDQTIERMQGHLEQLLGALATGAQKRVSELELLTEAERRQVLVEWNQSARNVILIDGRSIAATGAYILNRGLKPVPIGVAGELFLGGAEPARKYLNRPDSTAERFIPDPFSSAPGARLYQTSDRARYRADGEIEYVRPLDDQVKPVKHDHSDENIAPRNAIEELVIGIWSDVLKVKTILRGDNFFELGGHSLLGTQIVSRVREVFSVELPLRILFDHPALSEFSEAIEALLRGSELAVVPPLERASRAREIPLSFGQQRLWFLDQLEPESPFYNLHRAVRFNGELNVEALEQAFNEVVQRHESLRTTFQNNEGGVVQIIHPPERLRLQVEEVSGRSRPERQAETARIAFEESHAPFNLARGPLLRFRL